MRMIRAERKTERAVQRAHGFFPEAGFTEFATQHDRLRTAADGADKRETPATQGSLQNRPVGLVPLRDAENECLGRQSIDQGRRILVERHLKVRSGGQTRRPLRARIDHPQAHRKRQQHGHEMLNHVAGSEESDGPRFRGDDFEKQSHPPAACHADVALQVPLDPMCAVPPPCKQGRGLAQHSGLQFTSTNRACEKPTGIGKQARALILWRASTRGGHGDEDMGSTALLQCGGGAENIGSGHHAGH